MRVEFMRASDNGLLRTREMDVIPRKGDLIKFAGASYYIDEAVYNLETNVYRIYMYAL